MPADSHAGVILTHVIGAEVADQCRPSPHAGAILARVIGAEVSDWSDKEGNLRIAT